MYTHCTTKVNSFQCQKSLNKKKYSHMHSASLKISIMIWLSFQKKIFFIPIPNIKMYKNHGLSVIFFSFQTLLSFQSKYILRHSVTLCQMKLIFDEHEVGKRVLLMFFMYFQSKNIRDPNPIKNNCNFLTIFSDKLIYLKL